MERRTYRRNKNGTRKLIRRETIPPGRRRSNRSTSTRSSEQTMKDGQLLFPKTLSIWKDIDEVFKEYEVPYQYIYVTANYTPKYNDVGFYEDIDTLDWFRENLPRFMNYCAGSIHLNHAHQSLYMSYNYNWVDEEGYRSDIALRITPDRRIEGFAIIEGLGEKTLHIHDFCISAKGRGIGRDMLLDITGAAIEAGTKHIALSALHRAVPFYQRLGFNFVHKESAERYEAKKADPAYRAVYGMYLLPLAPKTA
jgi:hypothetical protein